MPDPIVPVKSNIHSTLAPPEVAKTRIPRELYAWNKPGDRRDVPWFLATNMGMRANGKLENERCRVTDLSHF